MLTMVIQKQFTKPFLLLNLAYFAFFFGMYWVIDSFNMSYGEMALTYGAYLVIINIILNSIMAILSMIMMGLTSAQFNFAGKESKGSNLSFISILFGILTYGCTPCVISFFAAIGISFSVAVLPLAGLPYKFISLALIVLGLVWVIYSINRTTCKVPSVKP